MEDDNQWQQWAVAAQQGDKKAYNSLLRDIVPYIRAVLGGSLANEDWADDIVQDILISVHKSLHTYTESRPFKPWLTSIIYFRRTDYLRKYYARKKLKDVVKEDAVFFGENVTEQIGYSELKDIERYLGGLNEKHKDAFILMKLEGYSASEVGEKLDMSESAVKVSVHRTKEMLKSAMEEGA